MREGNQNNLQHGFCRKSGEHSLYDAWQSIKQRCYNENHKHYDSYGGRGISVAPEWKNDSGEFCRWGMANGWAKGLQIDRIDNNGNYEPSNCRFVTCQENNQNKQLIQKNNSTGYRGVAKNSGRGKPFTAHVSQNKEIKHLGSFDTVIDAAMKRDMYVLANNITLPINFLEDTLLGRQLLDALENHLVVNHYNLWQDSACNCYPEYKPMKDQYQWRSDRIKYCCGEIGK